MAIVRKQPKMTIYTLVKTYIPRASYKTTDTKRVDTIKQLTSLIVAEKINTLSPSIFHRIAF